MRTSLIAIVVILTALSWYAYSKDPTGCARVAADIVSVVQTTIAASGHPAVAPAPGQGTPASSAPASSNDVPAPTSSVQPSQGQTPTPAGGKPWTQQDQHDATNQFELKSIDYTEGVRQAKAEGKLVLLHFTGSDWCPYCQDLDKEVLSQHSFQTFSVNNFVMVTLDFPHDIPLPDDVKQENQSLAQKYNVNEFPTLLVVDTDGREVGRNSGYNPGSGPGAVISELQQFCQH
jgi:thioredoxin-related protein